ncbi:histidine phosphotransferase family protein [Paracoccus zeaxanthinifaciens]|uniref:histidine phosphotransferase family protein n=1 Tax=Paracoccus zeaxanthinifaciens TaxID=187400 RepID=UPI0003B762B2|nr:histidine phosphotransferase family protein [Paracoccus zeaxanthinifaciens]
MSQVTTPPRGGDLAALLGSRLCHDLVSPLGAIGNGVELLEMSPDFPGIAKAPEIQLIAEAVASARSRIQAFRMAFGTAQDDQRVSRPELQKLVDGMSAHGRMKIQLEAEGDFPRTQVRLVMLALLCLETTMPWGGRVLVIRNAPGWRLVAECERARLDGDLWAWLSQGKGREAAPSEVQFPLLADALRGRDLTAEFDETGGEIAF